MIPTLVLTLAACGGDAPAGPTEPALEPAAPDADRASAAASPTRPGQGSIEFTEVNFQVTTFNSAGDVCTVRLPLEKQDLNDFIALRRDGRATLHVSDRDAEFWIHRDVQYHPNGRFTPRESFYGTGRWSFEGQFRDGTGPLDGFPDANEWITWDSMVDGEVVEAEFTEETEPPTPIGTEEFDARCRLNFVAAGFHTFAFVEVFD